MLNITNKQYSLSRKSRAAYICYLIERRSFEILSRWRWLLGRMQHIA